MKSRSILESMESAGIDPSVRQYLQQPPTVDELRALIRMLGVPAKALVRVKEPILSEMALDLDDDAAVLQAIQNHPRLLERPIVLRGDRGVIARPTERWMDLLTSRERSQLE